MWSSKIKWQVEQANVPSHAPNPSISRFLSTTTSSSESPTFPSAVSLSPSRFMKWTVTLSSELSRARAETPKNRPGVRAATLSPPGLPRDAARSQRREEAAAARRRLAVPGAAMAGAGRNGAQPTPPTASKVHPLIQPAQATAIPQGTYVFCGV